MRTGASYRIAGMGGGTAAAVTAALGITPTDAFEVGEPIGRTGSVRDVSLWHLRSDLPEGLELADHLNAVLDRLEPRTDDLWRLVEQGYEIDWFCMLASNAFEHAAELDRVLLHRLLSVPGELLIDAMGDGEDDEDRR
ncbi:DUF4279 domain-containing protein [Saccharothrix variisporea]|uniref:DUF4279 domain-containing protein n=1 Tax=Saccharothrix variisporea TaxID=543527 RepID=UPI00147753AC|nr:DUF4279 domain-containing protein [Saccharothrix variisporea]